jgi:hypothetical protein
MDAKNIIIPTTKKCNISTEKVVMTLSPYIQKCGVCHNENNVRLLGSEGTQVCLKCSERMTGNDELILIDKSEW